MSKRIFALILCVVMLIPCLAACGKATVSNDDKGSIITMYLSNNIVDFDPAAAYNDAEAIGIVGMLYDTLFRLSANGKIQKGLVDDYEIIENKEAGEYSMEITLKEAFWSNGTKLSAEDVVFAWKRLVNQNNDFAAASLLYDIKNARAVKNGDVTIDNLGVEALGENLLKVTFEGAIDYDQFMLNLTSVATAPLLENYVTKNADWAKKPATMVTSGPYKIGKINYKDQLSGPTYDKNGDVILDITTGQPYLEVLKGWDDNAIDKNGKVTTGNYPLKYINFFYLERNTFYDRDIERDPIDESVKNYRILVDCTMDDAKILEEYKAGRLFYVGNIPLSLRNDEYVKKNVEISDSLATFTFYLNEDADILNGKTRTETDSEGKETEVPDTEKLFANVNVRKALSLVIDRAQIANAIVYAEAATGLVCPGIFENGKRNTLFNSKDFRDVGGALIASSANMGEAQALLASAGITPSDYTFTVQVSAFNDVNVKITEMTVEAWKALGFNVELKLVQPIQNNDYLKEIDDIPSDVCDDIFAESLQRRTYEVIATDYVAYSADPYSMLSNFARPFSGMSFNMNTYELNKNITGYNSEAYNNIMEAVYYLPYFATLTPESTSFLGIYNENPAAYQATYNAVKAVYDTYGIKPSTKESDWAEQKTLLLHKAEELLMTEMPIIPVVFKKNAVLISDELKKVDDSFSFYYPIDFRKTTLKNYSRYIPVLQEFPVVDWSLLED